MILADLMLTRPRFKITRVMQLFSRSDWGRACENALGALHTLHWKSKPLQLDLKGVILQTGYQMSDSISRNHASHFPQTSAHCSEIKQALLCGLSPRCGKLDFVWVVVLLAEDEIPVLMLHSCEEHTCRCCSSFSCHCHIFTLCPCTRKEDGLHKEAQLKHTIHTDSAPFLPNTSAQWHQKVSVIPLSCVSYTGHPTTTTTSTTHVQS